MRDIYEQRDIYTFKIYEEPFDKLWTRLSILDSLVNTNVVIYTYKRKGKKYYWDLIGGIDEIRNDTDDIITTDGRKGIYEGNVFALLEKDNDLATDDDGNFIFLNQEESDKAYPSRIRMVKVMVLDMNYVYLEQMPSYALLIYKKYGREEWITEFTKDYESAFIYANSIKDNVGYVAIFKKLPKENKYLLEDVYIDGEESIDENVSIRYENKEITKSFAVSL